MGSVGGEESIAPGARSVHLVEGSPEVVAVREEEGLRTFADHTEHSAQVRQDDRVHIEVQKVLQRSPEGSELAHPLRREAASQPPADAVKPLEFLTVP